MASATNCEFNESLSKMTQSEADADICVEKQVVGELDSESGIQNEDKTFNETDLTELKSQQFSNNATTLGISVSKQPEGDSCIVTDSEPDVKCKNKLKESEIKDLDREEACAQDDDSCTESPVITSKDVHDDESCTDTPGITSQDEDTADDTDYMESAGDERIACIEEEYVQRISILEQRHSELENVLERLTTAVECGLATHRAKKGDEEVSHDSGENIEEKASKEEGAERETEPEKTERDISRGLIIELFVEFQQKIRSFAEDLNGVLNCSEAAIRHARVVQEWATSVQLMFEQLKEERHKILGYIDERERNMLIVKEQFIAELEEQGKTLKQLVEEMMSHHELQQEGEDYCKTKGESSNKRSTVEKIVDLLLKRRLEEDKAIILNLSKQSKISEMKLFIIHQQSCIQQLQEQNKELRAIIEGLMGPDDLEEEDPCDTDQTGTPASITDPDQCSVRESLVRVESPTVSLVSDILYCDRGEYLPGNSTDGDVATVQAYSIGRDSDGIKCGEDIIFDPLSVRYVREQCQQAEESERQAHLEVNNAGNSDQDNDVEKNEVKNEQDEVKQPSGEKNETEQISGEPDGVKQLSGEENEVQQLSGSENDSKACLQEAVVAPSEDTVDVNKNIIDESDRDNAAGDSVDIAGDSVDIAGDSVDISAEKEISPEPITESQSV